MHVPCGPLYVHISSATPPLNPATYLPPSPHFLHEGANAKRVGYWPKATQPAGETGIVPFLGACPPALLHTACDLPHRLCATVRPPSQQVPSETGHVSPFLLHLSSAPLQFHLFPGNTVPFPTVPSLGSHRRYSGSFRSNEKDQKLSNIAVVQSINSF